MAVTREATLVPDSCHAGIGRALRALVRPRPGGDVRLVSLRPFLAAFVVPGLLAAQGAELQGRVLQAGAPVGRVIGGAVVRVGDRQVRTDSLGRFRLEGLAGGVHVVRAEAPGFQAATANVELQVGEVFSRDFELAPAGVALPGVAVVGAPELRGRDAEIAERRRAGGGTYLDQAALEQAAQQGRRMGEILSMAGGIRIQRTEGKAFVVSGRQQGRIISRRPCYLDVYLDGVLIWGTEHVEPFDINSIQAITLAGVEIYNSAARVPARFNRTASSCGVMLLWTRAG